MPICRSCGARTSKYYSTCLNCGKPLRVPRSLETPSREEQRPGIVAKNEIAHGTSQKRRSEIDVPAVLNASISIIRKNPAVLLPVAFSTTISYSIVWALGFLHLKFELMDSLPSPFSQLISVILVSAAVSLLVQPIVQGMYPLMVASVLKDDKVRLSKAFKRSVRRFPSMLLSTALVSVIVIVGMFIFVLPGLLFLVSFYYTAPAIMLKNKGALDGMSASRKFARTRKWETFAMFLVVATLTGLPAILVPLAGTPRVTDLPTPSMAEVQTGAQIIVRLVNIPVSTMGAIMSSYAYIRYALRIR